MAETAADAWLQDEKSTFSSGAITACVSIYGQVRETIIVTIIVTIRETIIVTIRETTRETTTAYASLLLITPLGLM